MCQVVRVQDLLESMEDLLDREDPATGPTRFNAKLDDMLAPEEWSDDR